MKRKNIKLLLLSAVFSLPLFAGTPISLNKKPGQNTGSRTVLVSTLTANYDEDNDILCFEFSDATDYNIVISSIPTITEAPLIRQSNIPVYSTQVDISSLPSGRYRVDIYAFGCWWTGTFYIE